MAYTSKGLNEIVSFSRGTGATRVNSAGLIVGVDFSSTSNTIATGSKSFTLTADLNVNRDWAVGSSVIAVSQAGATGTMTGTVTSYTPSTQELVINVTSITGSGTSTNWRIGSLEARQDFDPVTLQPKGLLVEGGATNISYSNDFGNAAWSKVPGTTTVASGQGISPDGSNNFWKLSIQQPGGDTALRRSSGLTAGSLYTLTIYAKKSGATPYLTIGTSNSPNQYATLNLDTGDVTTNTAGTYAPAGRLISAESRALGNGVYKLVVRSTLSVVFDIAPRFDLAGPTATATTLGATEALIYQADYVLGRVEGSPIPTTTVSVTRAADQANVNGSNFSQAYNSKQGTLVVEMTPISSAVHAVGASINDGTVNNAIRFAQKQTGTLSSIRKMATDGVTDVMAIANLNRNSLSSNGIVYTENNSAIDVSFLGVASASLGNFLSVGPAEAFQNTTDSGATFRGRYVGAPKNGAHFGIGRFVIATSAINGGNATGSSGGAVEVSTDGLSFRRVNIAGLTQDVRDITSNGTNQYVAVGNGGVIYTSPDAETWAAQTSGTSNNINGITHNGTNLYVAALSSTTTSIRTSPDGINWTARTTANASLSDVAYNGTNLYVAVGVGGSIQSSPDGITWTLRTSNVTTQLNGVHFADNLWVAVGAAGTIVTSPDGITWTNRTETSGTTQELREVSHFNGKFYYVGAGQVIGENTATNIVAGIVWTARTANVGAQLEGIAHNGSRLLICGTNGAITTSEDGITFTSRTGNAAQLNGAAFGNGTYVVVGNAVNGSGLIATVDPTTFAYQRRVSNTASQINSVKLHRGVFYGSCNASGGSTKIIRSTDAISWVETIIPGASFNLQDTADNGTVIVAVGSTGRRSISSDGLVWSSSALTGATTQQLNSIDFANGVFVAVGNAGTIITSPDGTTWTLGTSATTANLFSVMFSTRDNQWYAAGDNGTILRSADAITWENISNDAIAAIVKDGRVIKNDVNLTNLIPNQTNKILFRYNDASADVWINGTKQTTYSVGLRDLRPMTQLSIGMSGDQQNFFNGWIRGIKYYPLAKSDVQAEALTSI